MLLKNKVVLITGASQGLGKHLALGFLREGAHLFICSRSIEKLKKVVKELKELKSEDQKIYFSNIDISKENEVDDLLDRVLYHFRKIDILINNAGILGPIGSFENSNWKEWQNVINTNLSGSAYLIYKFTPLFKKQSKGCIIQISGGGATAPFPYFSAYAASKVAIVRFIETIALELKDYNITANCISPGVLNTKMQQQVLNAGPSKVGDAYYKKILGSKSPSFSRSL